MIFLLAFVFAYILCYIISQVFYRFPDMKSSPSFLFAKNGRDNLAGGSFCANAIIVLIVSSFHIDFSIFEFKNSLSSSWKSRLVSTDIAQDVHKNLLVWPPLVVLPRVGPDLQVWVVHVCLL